MRVSTMLGCGLATLALVACGKSASDETAMPNANAATAAVAAVPVAPPTLPRVEGRFVAISNTAMSVTGDLTLASDRLGFAFDQDYATGPVTAARAGDAYAGADNWADLFGIAPDTPVEIRSVIAETTGKNARNGGLCGKDKTDFVAIAVKAAGTPDALLLLLSAFKGGTAPGQGAPADSLCGTFTYMPKGA